jgi:hypothetical protein
MTDSAAEKYLSHRAIFRERAKAAFFANNSKAADLLDAMSELVSATTLFLSGKDLSATSQRLYLSDLLVSFCRSHFIAADLVVHTELIEAATLIRKQMELMARVQELSKSMTIEELLRRTPNVRHLASQLRRLYDEYSRIAHSADPETLRLLGTTHSEGRSYTPVYPEFDPNAYVALNHLGWLCVEFDASTTALYAEWFPDVAPPQTADFFATIAEVLAIPQHLTQS